MYPYLLNSGMVEYVSEEPHLTFLKDTTVMKADLREIPLTDLVRRLHHAS